MKGKKTGGRKKGSVNQRTKALDRAAAKGLTPLDYMLKVMRNTKAESGRRDEMAKAAAPYLHARRAPEDKQGKTVAPVVWHRPSLEKE